MFITLKYFLFVVVFYQTLGSESTESTVNLFGNMPEIKSFTLLEIRNKHEKGLENFLRVI